MMEAFAELKDLLQKAGVQPEFTGRIIESLESYKSTIKESLEAEFVTKISKAKKICVEETETYKRDLARRVQIFCETKGAAIEAQLRKQSVSSESKSTSKLNKIAALVEGVELNVGNDGKLRTSFEAAKAKIRQLVESRDKANELANKQTSIARKILAESQGLESENIRLKRMLVGTKTFTENRAPKVSRPNLLPRKSLSQNATTTRPTLVESQDPSTPPKQPAIVAGGYNINSIAANLDENLI